MGNSKSGGMGMQRGKRRVPFGAAFWGFMLFLTVVGTGLHQAGRQMDQMLGWEGRQTVFRLGQTSDGRLDISLLGGRYRGPHLPEFLRAKSRGVGGQPGPKQTVPEQPAVGAKAGWRRLVQDIRVGAARLAEGISQLFSDWQIDGPLQEKAPPR